MEANAVLLEAPERLALKLLILPPLGPSDLLVQTRWSGVSSGTEKLLWSGRMPSFPGMGYPLVPGYESVGEIVDAGAEVRGRIGEQVFIPGASCWTEARSLFGATANRLVVASARAVPLPERSGADAILLSLAATAHHALAGGALPELIVGHGILGRLLARMVIALGGAEPTVWEARQDRRQSGNAYYVIEEGSDVRRDYRAVCDASGDPTILDRLTGRIARGGEIVLAGFYETLSFAFPPAFMREARIRIAAEFTPADMHAVLALTASGALSLAGLISHVRPAAEAGEAYPMAFDDPACLKMVLDWKGCA